MLILVAGDVHGVGFRAWTKRMAGELGLCGWVRNLHDGRVEICAEGDHGCLEELVRRCHAGPRSAEVVSVHHAFCTAEGHEGFVTRPTAGGPEARA